MISYTKFTFKEFRVCARAWFAFGAGYKLGERYRLGELERRHGQSADPEAWQGRKPNRDRHRHQPDAAAAPKVACRGLVVPCGARLSAST